jgi:hypothetical protein
MVIGSSLSVTRERSRVGPWSGVITIVVGTGCPGPVPSTTTSVVSEATPPGPKARAELIRVRSGIVVQVHSLSVELRISWPARIEKTASVVRTV